MSAEILLYTGVAMITVPWIAAGLLLFTRYINKLVDKAILKLDAPELYNELLRLEAVQ